MTWVWIVLAVLALLVAIPLAIGAATSRTHTATVTRSHAAPPERIWELLTDFPSMAQWRGDVRRVEVLDPTDGKRRIREHSSFGPLTYVLEVEDPPHRLVSRIADADRGFGGSWTFVLEPDAGGTRLAITEDGFIDNLLFRFLARWVFGYDATLRRYHDALARRLERG